MFGLDEQTTRLIVVAAVVPPLAMLIRWLRTQKGLGPKPGENPWKRDRD